MGFIIGPLMARRGLRKAEHLYASEALMAHQRDRGFSWWQWWVMTPLSVDESLLGLLSAQRAPDDAGGALGAVDQLKVTRAQAPER